MAGGLIMISFYGRRRGRPHESSSVAGAVSSAPLIELTVTRRRVARVARGEGIAA